MQPGVQNLGYAAGVAASPFPPGSQLGVNCLGETLRPAGLNRIVRRAMERPANPMASGQLVFRAR